MSEETPESGDFEEERDQPAPERETESEPEFRREPQQGASVEQTGHPLVDDMLSALDSLDTVPINEQVPVFEAAHETLRSALADAGNES